MQLELLAAAGVSAQHLVVQLLERRAGAEQAEPRADAGDVGVDRDVAQAVGEQQHAGGGLAADAGQRAEARARLARPAPSRIQRQVEVVRAAPARISLIRRDFDLQMPPGRIASSISATGASRTASQTAKRSRSRRKATSRLRSFVDCESTVRISSPSGSPCGSIAGTP